MATIKFADGSDFTKQLQKLSEAAAQEVIGHAIYEGAAVMMDYVKRGVESIETDEGFGTPDNPNRGPSRLQKEALMTSAGIAKMREDNGLLNVKIGFGGYNGKKTKRWPQGAPNAVVARSVERGTSFMLPQPFMKRAVNAAKADVLKAMENGFNEKMKEIMEEK